MHGSARARGSVTHRVTPRAEPSRPTEAQAFVVHRASRVAKIEGSRACSRAVSCGRSRWTLPASKKRRSSGRHCLRGRRGREASLRAIERVGEEQRDVDRGGQVARSRKAREAPPSAESAPGRGSGHLLTGGARGSSLGRRPPKRAGRRSGSFEDVDDGSAVGRAVAHLVRRTMPRANAKRTVGAGGAA
jgi:hypothetical protein